MQDTFNMFGNFATNNGGDGTEVLMIYGKQDRHVDGDGRLRTYKLMTDAGVHFEWLEVTYAYIFYDVFNIVKGNISVLRLYNEVLLLHS
jgi:hypothetical protein